MKEDTKKLTDVDFKWDDADFFGIKEETDKVDEIVEEVKKEIKVDDKKETVEDKTDTKEVKEEKEETFFEEEKEEVKIEEEEEIKDDFFVNLTKDLKERNVFSTVDIPEDEVIDEEKFFELHTKEVENRVDEVFQGFFEELDDDGAAFLKFKKEGGNTKDFFKVYSQGSNTPKLEDLETDHEKEAVIKHYLQNYDDIDSSDIESRITWMKDNNVIDKYSDRYSNKIKEIDKKSKIELEKRIEENKKIEAKQRSEFKTEIKSFIKDNNVLDEFQVKSSLVNYITEPSIKVGVNQYVTPLQNKLAEVFKDREKLVKLSVILESDFDFSDLVKKVETKNTREIKSNLRRQSETKKSSSRARGRKSLAEWF